MVITKESYDSYKNDETYVNPDDVSDGSPEFALLDFYQCWMYYAQQSKDWETFQDDVKNASIYEDGQALIRDNEVILYYDEN